VTTEEVDPHLTAKIVQSYVRHHNLESNELADLITLVHRAIGQLGQLPEPDEVLTPAVSVRRSVHRDYVICLDCGYRGKTLRRHIGARHGLGPDEYRQRWGLWSSHQLTAPAYSERRSSLAKELGLGRKPLAKMAPPTTPAASASVDRAENPKAGRTRRPRSALQTNDAATGTRGRSTPARTQSRARAASQSA
jgi:predicted transcriptional regulator